MITQEKVNFTIFEQIKTMPELEKRIENEAKYAIMNGEAVEYLRDESDRITQTYISTPEDDYSLRVRKVESPTGETRYVATVKNRGNEVDGVLQRLEFETPIIQEAFEFFSHQEQFPTIYKNRATLQEGVTIDFIDGLEVPILEIEGHDQEDTLRYFSDLKLQPANHSALNETLAYGDFIPSKEQPSLTDTIMEAILELYPRESPLVIGIAGTSGSGKSTTAREVRAKIIELFGDTYAPIVISTDDYHRGKSYLEETYGEPWTNWDHPLTYNTRLMANELALYKKSGHLLKRHFDFQQEEVVYDEPFVPSPFVIVEGIRAGSKDLAGQIDVLFEMPTGHATSIGRDLVRIITENRGNASLGTPEERLRYQIEVALPTYMSMKNA